MQKDINIKTTDKKVIYGKLSIPTGSSQGLVVFMHGLTSSKDEPIIKNGAIYFTKKGYMTYTFNFYGKGKDARKLEKSSLKDHIKDTNNVIAYFKKQGIKKIFLIGHSFGGLTILHSKVAGIAGIILWDSSIGGQELLSDILYDKTTKKHMINRGEGFTYTINETMYKDFCIPSRKHIEKIKNIKNPIKIICAEKGLQKPGEKYYKVANKPKDFSIISGASHNFNKKEEQKELFKKTYIRIKKYS